MPENRRFAIVCNHCHHQVGPPVAQIGEGEAAMLREHLRICARDLRPETFASVGELLNHFRLTPTA